MPDGRETPAARLVADLGEIAAADWNALAGDANPFLRHEFLRALEESGSVGGETGWLPRHLVVENAGGTPVGAVPLYVKAHSYGEYVFDHGWADAWERAGGRYYPKLLAGVPFTPVPGPRLLVGGDRAGGREAAEVGSSSDSAPDESPRGETPSGADRRRLAIAETLIAAARQLDVSSLHATFLEPADRAALEQAGCLLRLGHQYHWNNRGYRTFDDFLGALASRKRKAIRRERQAIAQSGVRIRRLTGDGIRLADWDNFYALYVETGSRKWGWPYLTQDFFHRLGAAMAKQVLLVMADLDGTPVGGALNLIGRDTLYGRNWGGSEAIPFLHFECCYYQAIEFAIERGLARVEAGAQGEHKIQRGYLPVETWSAHWIRDDGFRTAVADFLVRETRAMKREIAALAEYGPYRNDERGAAKP